MNYLKYFERYSDQTYDFIYSNFLEIADDYNFTKVDDNNYFDINDCLSVLKRSVEYMQGLGYNYNCGYIPERGGNRRFFVNQKGAFHMGHEITEKIYIIHVSFYL